MYIPKISPAELNADLANAAARVARGDASLSRGPNRRRLGFRDPGKGAPTSGRGSA
jgi:hypothetical protein